MVAGALRVLACAVLFASPVVATSLSPFIDLQEKGLTLVEDGKGMAGGLPVSLSVTVGGPVRFALLYWAGSDSPCTLSSGACTFTQPFHDQQVTFGGNAITGTVIGSETDPAVSRLAIGYYADVTAIVAAAGTGAHSFSFGDGDTGSNLTDRDGVSLVVGFTAPADPITYRVQIQDGLDFAYGDSATPGDPRVTSPITFDHGLTASSRTAQLLIVGGDGEAARPDNLTISNNPTLFNTFDSSDGAQWDSDVSSIDIPAGVGSTTVQVNSAPAGQNPDDQLWEMAALRVPQIDTTPPSCPVVSVSQGPPKQVTFSIQDTDSGLASIVVTQSGNADTPVPPFTVGSTDALSVTATKIDQSQPMHVVLQAADLADNVANCEYNDAIGTIVIDKDAQPDSGQDFSFTGSGAIGTFSLDDDADPTLPSTRTFQLDPGSYTVGEGAPVGGYALSNLSCSLSADATSTVSPNLPGRTVTIGLAGGDTVHCTFVNSLQDATPPSCSVTPTAGPPKTATFSIQDTGSGLASIVVTRSVDADTIVPPFTVGTPDPVSVGSIKIDQSQPMAVSMTVTDVAGNSVQCGYADARVDVTKDAVPDGPQDFSFTGSGTIGAFSLDDDADPTLPRTRSFIVELGGYTVTEAAIPGFATTVGCTDPTTDTTTDNATRAAAIAAGAGETVACTFTNTGLPDLSISKTTTAQDPLIRQTFVYLLAVTNEGPGAATGVQVSDTLPAQLTFVSSDCGAAAVGQVVTWNVGSLAPSGSAQCHLTVEVVNPGTIVNEATVTSNEPDPNPDNNSATARVLASASAIPTLNEWGALTLALAMAWLGLRAVRRFRAPARE